MPIKMPNKRILGGQKNENSGKKWRKDELRKVFELYLSNPELKIHENSKEIAILSQRINRTIRSIEAQLLMFRNLSRHGDYSFGNMNTLCKELWQEYVASLKSKQ